MPPSDRHLRILFVAQAISIHTARWISQLTDQGWDLHVFDMLGSFPHAELQGVTEYSLLLPRKIPILAKEPSYGHDFFLTRGWDPFPISLAGFFIRRLFRRRAQRLAALIQKLKPDVIHAIELQTQGYELLPVMDIVGDLGAPCILSTWGSDLFYFQHFPAHLEKIQRLLSTCDYLIPDCHRDEALARDLGFRGQIPLVLPGSGGYPVEKMRRLMAPGPVHTRRLIMVKGYQGWAGRAQDALDALGLCSDVLSGYEIVVYVASDSVRRSVAEMRARTGLNLRILERSPHTEILKLFGRARLAIAVNITDGIPNAMLEAMTMGAFPIQSNTESTAEWITHGRNGLLVEPGDPAGIAKSIRRALSDDALVDQAAERNLHLVTDRLDLSTVKPQVIEMYRNVAASLGRS
ncbi:MAG TPA: glycosyltransferase family 4 protein [Anaerolineales bacterium]